LSKAEDIRPRGKQFHARALAARDLFPPNYLKNFSPENDFCNKNISTENLAKSIMSPTTQMNSTQAIGKKPQLQLGSQGKAVLELEQLLTKLGVYRQPAKGIFNKSVQFAVKLFQFRVFLPPDGIVGPLTWQVLYTEDPVNMPVLRLGSSGKAVATVQEVLKISKHYGGKVDGDFSTLTEKAVRAFQKSFGIEVEGIINQETWTALSRIPRGYDPKWFLT
jgi:peptidoglycan hydrolase-like protein with peptidoglycan-binding domain